MPRGRKSLNPDEKLERRRATLAKYALKNREKLQESACQRMRRKRAALTDADKMSVKCAKGKVHESAARYRESNHEAIRTADTMRRARKYIAENGVEASDEKSSRKHLAKTQRCHEGQPPPLLHPKALPIKLTKRQVLAAASMSDAADTTEEEGEGEGDMPYARPVFPGRTPHHWQECEAGCGTDGCDGCACICGPSTVWISHEHYRTPKWEAAGCPRDFFVPS
ncbi:hypothetical protein B0H17DRAFT_1130052 [Mycena rosella]|uniref:Uncharacterized protein n=1 Tax=Mycena rosella TaxID=1033263 RepID=A0AAD7DRN2_MYCRO|nr:hypothetical protein B0H17DRAFT_1130052 [Mycena rosella]